MKNDTLPPAASTLFPDGLQPSRARQNVYPDLNLAHEEEIVWLHPHERYAYLRESETDFAQRRAFPMDMRPTGKNNDGGEGTHLVAYAVLKQSAPSSRGYFRRRYWWVKSYDRFEGHGTDHGSFYDTGHPCEAVRTDSVVAGQPTVRP